MRKFLAGILLLGIGAGAFWFTGPYWPEIASTIPTLKKAVEDIQGLHVVKSDALPKEEVPMVIARHLQNRDQTFTIKYKVDPQIINKYQEVVGTERKNQITKEIDLEFKRLFDHALREDEYLEHVIEKYTCRWTYSDWTKEVTLYFDEIVYRESKQETEAVDVVAERLVDKLIRPEMTEYQKVKKIHDYIVNHVKYVLVDNGREKNTAYTALFEKRSACYGYSMLAYKMLEKAGVDAHIVTGKAIADFNDGKLVGHAWNLVKIKGQWYHMDVTFDDPIGPSDAQKPFYDYFLISDKRIKKNHFWNPEEQKYDMPVAERSYPR
ncbi:transglutaminase domain-containing protein [Thermoflavimicrobium dichotomicum]|uniref:Transglutaminase-like superfamily protein n=1 Tax=Thermoflavimicrobium dichotomicum TaxID=46223 RepID=A0A1I3RF11_9BACL|nr:transglutaminase domain-containing protein [Thermoflavimicrobium dichotomicum]SFJ45214.1 Transglutaminase-like superfamily protein [Thermoflavimicrobium dichotomicum]